MLRRTGLRAVSDKTLAARANRGENTFSTFPTRSSSLTRTAPTNRAARRRQPALPAPQMAKLKTRSKGVCEIQVPGCTWEAVDPAHRNGSRIGGRHGEAAVAHGQLSNVLYACRHCHDWTHANPAKSKDKANGWALEEWQKPAEWPARYRGVLSRLFDDGRVEPVKSAPAVAA